ncbi:aprataxin and PNK-like factor [Drosophila ficusphila]|uniref:aprataxin and PNK-like factor n=1 Tax=Drosophila ficusphila TaxID=30025 RepID=UPI0007E7A64D|nr:aprataxin and PNK-like factor [Drosophila ficusphila]
MSSLEENSVDTTAEADSGLEAENGIKRKSPEEASNNCDANGDVENSPSKRLKSDEPTPSIKTEPNPDTPVSVKAEPVDEDTEEAEPAVEATTSDPLIQVKAEPAANGDLPAARVVKTEPTRSNEVATADSSVSSSSTRISCRFGIRCYRRNPVHRSAEAHPGDSDYRRPDFPEPPLGTPACPFGNACYRRNPVHFQEHSHPADFNSAQNIRNRLRQRQNRQTPDDDEDFGSDEEEDPFGGDNDNDADYRPGADIDEDEDDELEFESQRINNDEYD